MNIGDIKVSIKDAKSTSIQNVRPGMPFMHCYPDSSIEELFGEKQTRTIRYICTTLLNRNKVSDASYLLARLRVVLTGTCEDTDYTRLQKFKERLNWPVSEKALKRLRHMIRIGAKKS